GFVVVCIDFAEACGGRALPPTRRFQARDAAALLVDQNRRMAVADRVTQGCNEAADLVAVMDIAREEDEPPGLHLAKECTFIGTEGHSGAAEDRARAHRSYRIAAKIISTECTRRLRSSAFRRARMRNS